MSHGNIVITKVLKRNAFRGIFKKTFNLRNFAFYNFSENLGFGSQKRIGQPYSYYILLQDTTWNHYKNMYLKTYGRKITRRVIVSETCILRNFAFYNFTTLSFQSLEEGRATLQLLLISRSIITLSKLYKKNAVNAIFREILHFTSFPRILVFSCQKRI